MAKRIKVTGSYNTHVLNHRVLLSLRKMAQSNHEHSFRFKVAEIVFAAFTLEGYINTVVQNIDEDIWSKERSFFSKDPYRGTLGKVCWIHEQLNLEKPDSSKGLFQRIKRLFRARDKLAHAKQLTYEGVTKLGNDGRPERYGSPIEKLFTQIDPAECFDDIIEVCRVIHECGPNNNGSERIFSNILSQEHPDFVDKNGKRSVTITTLEPLYKCNCGHCEETAVKKAQDEFLNQKIEQSSALQSTTRSESKS
jgi:hypothetical protein